MRGAAAAAGRFAFLLLTTIPPVRPPHKADPWLTRLKPLGSFDLSTNEASLAFLSPASKCVTPFCTGRPAAGATETKGVSQVESNATTMTQMGQL